MSPTGVFRTFMERFLAVPVCVQSVLLRSLLPLQARDRQMASADIMRNRNSKHTIVSS